MQRRDFIKLFTAAAVGTLVAPQIPASTDLYRINFSIEERFGFGRIHPKALAEAFAMVQKADLAPSFMFMHPLEYKVLNPDGYAKLVELQA